MVEVPDGVQDIVAYIVEVLIVRNSIIDELTKRMVDDFWLTIVDLSVMQQIKIDVEHGFSVASV